MNHDDIERIAADAGIVVIGEGIVVTGEAVVKLCELVAAAEREACAEIAKTLGVHPTLNVWNGGPDWYKHGQDIAAAIRARGKTK